MDPDQDICVLCGKDGGQMNVVGNKGLNIIIRASIEKQENDIHAELIRLQQSQCPVHVYHDCHRRFVDLRKRTDSLPRPKKLRSSTDVVFKWETCCFLCLILLICEIEKEIRYVKLVLYQFTQL